MIRQSRAKARNASEAEKAAFSAEGRSELSAGTAWRAESVDLTTDEAVTKLAPAAEHGELGKGVVDARAHSSERTGIECTFPPRKWDNNLGRLVTVRQPNQRRKPRGVSEIASQLAPTARVPDAGQIVERPELSERAVYPAEDGLSATRPYIPIDPCESYFLRKIGRLSCSACR